MKIHCIAPWNVLMQLTGNHEHMFVRADVSSTSYLQDSFYEAMT